MTIEVNIKQRIGWLDARLNLSDLDKEYITFQMKEMVNDVLEQVDNSGVLDSVRERFSDIDKITTDKINSEYSHEDLTSEDEGMAEEITMAEAWYAQGIRDVLNAL